MNKLSVARSFALILLGLNLILIAVIFFKKPPHPSGPRDLIIERLAFDKDQVAAYDELIKMHQDQIKLSDLQIIKLKNTLYSTLNTGISSVSKDSMIFNLATAQSKIEDIHYKHFLDIRMLCKPEQISLFEALTLDLANYFSPKGKRRR